MIAILRSLTRTSFPGPSSPASGHLKIHVNHRTRHDMNVQVETGRRESAREGRLNGSRARPAARVRGLRVRAVYCLEVSRQYTVTTWRSTELSRSRAG